MVKLNLMPEESIVLKSKSVMHGGLLAAYTDDLILTNKHVIHISKGILGNTKKITKYPLNLIKISNGEPQVILEKYQNGVRIEIYYENEQVQFAFGSSNKREGAKWVNEIYKLLTGNESPKVSAYPLIPGTEYIAETLKGTIHMFKNVFNGQNSVSNNAVPVEVNTSSCISCSAPLTYEKGRSVQCKYCDTVQVF